ncbi:hypothetical protein [Ammoniphilus resinae]|uniref:Beta-lactamase regulating signal transducer with metallopeptidase domain n=1 Tax=Ammoniphilus resinae TaxID=861532 RepID=A0ABS4GSV7_9BACL|nr:hypothetical protein [Ammoniphilus resinae]MBP1933358.1 beta-lactamase regulating signal transducer with metallopeptidase domain [Ammoniphilus resinae]
MLEKLEKEIEERVEMLENPAYDYGQTFNRQDVLGILVVAVICVLGLIWGNL